MGNLKINDFAIIIRNIVDLGKPKGLKTQTKESVANVFKEIAVSPETELFTIRNYVFQRVCTLSKDDILRLELPSVKVLNKPKIYFWDDETILKKFESEPLLDVNIYPMLHHSGVLMVNLHARFCNPDGISIADAIESTRLNLNVLAIKIPKNLTTQIPLESKEDCFRWIKQGDDTYLVGTLKDLCSELIRPLFIYYLRKSFQLEPVRDYRCISSTLIQVYQTDPVCDSIEDFVQAKNFGREMRGIGSLDKAYEERTAALVEESFANNLSVDQELGVFTFGLSDLILFTTTAQKIVDKAFSEKKYKDRYAAVIYNTSHYSSLFEWVYLEKYIIDVYSRLLSKTIATEDVTPEKMLTLQKQSMRDLIAYTSGITPFPSREEFLEKARIAHRIPELQEKLEKKRDLATDYVIQEYTLKTNKSIQLVNIFISATAAFGLMQVIINIYQVDHRTVWSVLTVALFVVTIFILWGMNKILMAKKEE